MKFYNIILFILILSLTGCFFFNSNNSQESREIEKGDDFFTSGDVDKALQLWQQSLDKKKTVQVYEKIIMAYIIKNDLSAAEKWTQEGLSYFPSDVNLLFNHSLINYHKNEYLVALEGFDRVLSVDKHYPNAHFLKGMIYEKMGHKEEAKKEFVNEININPGSGKTWLKIREEAKNGK